MPIPRPILAIPAEVHRRISTHLVDSYPSEGCGVLVGKKNLAGSYREVHRSHAISNASEQSLTDSYELDAEEFLLADKQAAADALEIVGVYHSHPDSAASPSPSATDLLRAKTIWKSSTSFSYLIVNIAADRSAKMSSWRLERSAFVQETIKELVGA